MDLVLENGTVIDGTGAPRRQNCCLIRGGKIAEMFGVNYFSGQRQLFLPINDNYKLFQNEFLFYTGAGRSRG
jgi:hypothetical protein